MVRPSNRHYGRYFNPVHVLTWLRRTSKAKLRWMRFGLCQIIFHHKNAPLTSAKDRATMLDLATRDNPKFRVKLLELFRGGVSYTVDNALLKGKAPQNNYYLIGKRSLTVSIPGKKHLLWLKCYAGRNSSPWLSTRSAISNDLGRCARYSFEFYCNCRSVATGTSIRYLVPNQLESILKKKGFCDETNI